MTTALVLFAALLLDAVFGEPKRLWSQVPHPAVLMGRLIAFLDRRMNQGKARKFRGILCVGILLGTGLGFGKSLAALGPGIEILAGAILLAHRSLVEHVAEVAHGLQHSLEQGRVSVSMIVSRDTNAMDESQVARAAIESAAENFSDGVLAPAFWLLVGGLPGLITYKIINTADSMIGYRTPRHEAFGWAAARLDDLLNLVPARLTAILIAAVSWQWDVQGIIADARKHRSPNAGWPEAAMSRALGIALSGPRAYEGEMRDFPWVNQEGRRDLSPEDIDETITMLWKTWGALCLACALLAILSL